MASPRISKMSYFEPGEERGAWQRFPLPARILLVGLLVVLGVLVLWRVGQQRARQAEAGRFLQEVEKKFGSIDKFAFEDLPRSKEAAEAFIKDVRSGQFDAAYGSTTDTFRAEISRQALEDMASRVPGPDKSDKPGDEYGGLIPGGTPVNRDTYRWWFMGPERDGKRPTFAVMVVRTAQGWQVNSLTVKDSAEEAIGGP